MYICTCIVLSTAQRWTANETALCIAHTGGSQGIDYTFTAREQLLIMASVCRQKLMSNTTNWHIRVSIKPKWLFGGGRSGHTRQGLPSYPSQRNVRSHDPDSLMLKDNLNVHNNDLRTRLIPRFFPLYESSFPRAGFARVFSHTDCVGVCGAGESLTKINNNALQAAHSAEFPSSSAASGVRDPGSTAVAYRASASLYSNLPFCERSMLHVPVVRTAL